MSVSHGIDWAEFERKWHEARIILEFIEANPQLNGELKFFGGDPYFVAPMSAATATPRSWRARYRVHEYLEALTTDYCAPVRVGP